jgi:hypothetical protein
MDLGGEMQKIRKLKPSLSCACFATNVLKGKDS